MSPETWSAVASTCSAAFTFAGLSAIWFQLQANRLTMQASIDAQIYQRLDTINQLLIEHPEVEEALEQEYGQVARHTSEVRNLADMYLTLFEQIFRQRRAYGSILRSAKSSLMPQLHWEAWESTIRNAMNSKYLRSYWSANANR